MVSAHVDAGSFRDRGGRVHHRDKRIFRTVESPAAEDYQFTRNCGLVAKLISDQLLIDESIVDNCVLGPEANDAQLVLEHPKIPFVSWPYEWPFAALKSAAQLHLDIQVKALACDVVLSDASAYNIQFDGHRPIFIDSLSFRRYMPGEYWTGHRQFCEQFLNPLVLQAKTGVPFQPWFRGSLEGVSSLVLNELLPWYRKLSWNVMSQVWLQARFQARRTEKDAQARMDRRKLSQRAYREILLSLRRWVDKLEPRRRSKSNWQDYTRTHSYTDDESAAKKAFVQRFVERVAPDSLLDCGCNTGDYSFLALDAGAKRVVGIDSDEAAIDIAYRRSRDSSCNFLPLVIDACNPSPSQGWLQKERSGLKKRVSADALLALALVHHLVIASNLRMEQVVHWLISLSPTGVIEFVPKTDPMVQRLLALRDDIFTDYSEANFEHCLRQDAEIVETETISQHGRKLYAYKRHDTN